MKRESAKSGKWVMLPIFLVIAAQATAAEPAAVPVRFVPHWSPQSQFAGYYVAFEKGLYRNRGLDVTVLKGGPDVDALSYLADGKADIATMFLTGALARRDQGMPLVHLGQVVNQCSQLLVAWKNQGIRTLPDLKGRKVSVWGGNFRPAYLALFKGAGVEPAITDQYYSVNLFLLHGVTACAAMYYNEYHVLYQCGVDADELTTFALKDYGLGFPEDGLYCTAETLRQHPEACRAFAEASLEGWRYAAEHPQEALDIVMHYVEAEHVPTNRLHMQWMLEKILPTIVPGPNDAWRLGELARGDYEKAAALMKEYGLIASAPSFEAFRGEGGPP